MQIHVEKVKDKNVYGSTQFGNIRVIWEGNSPEIDKSYFVELDIEGVYTWGKDITLSCDNKCSILCDDKSICLTGTLESVDDDGYAVLRMEDFIIPILTQGTSFEVNSIIEIRVNLMSAFPVSFDLNS